MDNVQQDDRSKRMVRRSLWGKSSRRGIAVAVMLLATAGALTGCAQPESVYSAPIRDELHQWSDRIRSIAGGDSGTAVIETDLSGYSDADMGPAIAMCDQLEVAERSDWDGLLAVRIETQGGVALRSCLLDK